MDSINKFYDNKRTVYNFRIGKGSLYEKVLNLIGDKKVVLDVGSANGNFAGEVVKKGNIVYGIEISKQMAKKSEKVLEEVLVGNIEELKLPWKNYKFDIILVMDVLEHLFDPEAALKKLEPKLKQNGKIICSLPNVANWTIRLDLLRGDFNYTNAGILETGHVRFFTKKTAEKLFLSCGFKIISFDLVCNVPSVLVKISHYLPFINLQEKLTSRFPTLFGYQFIFVLKKK